MHIERCSVRAVVVTELRRSVCFDSMYTGAPCGLLAYTLSLRYYVDMLSFAPVRAVHARLSRPLAAPVPAARREALLPSLDFYSYCHELHLVAPLACSA